MSFNLQRFGSSYAPRPRRLTSKHAGQPGRSRSRLNRQFHIADPFLSRPQLVAAIDEAWSQSRRNAPFDRSMLDEYNARRNEEYSACLAREDGGLAECEDYAPEEFRPSHRGSRFREVGFYIDAAGQPSQLEVAELPWKVSIPVAAGAHAVFHTHPRSASTLPEGIAPTVSPEDQSALRMIGNAAFYVIERDVIDRASLGGGPVQEARIVKSWRRAHVRSCTRR